MPKFASRFRRKAGLLALLVALGVVGAIVAAVILSTGPDPSTSLVAWAVSGALATGAAVFAVSSLRRSVGMARVRDRNPGGLVFLARRQPALVSDLETYLAGTGVAVTVADRWLIALADERGLSAWSLGRGSRELLVMPWADLGSIEVTELETGRPGVAVDVKPFATPLVVSVGYSAYGILAALDRAGVAEVVEGSNAQRPAAE